MKRQTQLTLFALLFAFGSIGRAAIVEITIPKDVGNKDWNTKETTINLKVGDVLRITNLSDEVQAMHTEDDRPCKHTRDIDANGGSYDAKMLKTYNSATEGPLHSHYHTDAHIYLTVSAQDDE